MRSTWAWLVVAGAVLLCAASGASARVHSVRGGCGGTRLYRGALPSWTAPAMADSKGPQVEPFALSRRRDVTAIIFGYPLKDGGPGRARHNKILWIMRLPRRGLPLHISARPLHANRPLVRESLPADASPGEIYPSYLNVPKPGCWLIKLRWAGHSDEMGLRYS